VSADQGDGADPDEHLHRPRQPVRAGKGRLFQSLGARAVEILVERGSGLRVDSPPTCRLEEPVSIHDRIVIAAAAGV
jgi:hypothetical protein